MSAELVDVPVMVPRGRMSTRDAAVFNVLKQQACRLPIMEIHRQVASFYAVDAQELRESRRRLTRISHPRQVAMFLMRELTPLSFPCIASFYGFDHTSALHGCRMVRARISKNWRETGDQVEQLRALLTGQAGWSLHLWRPLRLEHAALAAYCRAVEERGKPDATRKPSPPKIARPISEAEATARRLRQL